MIAGARGYGEGGVDAILSTEAVAAEAQSLAAGGVSGDQLFALAGPEPLLTVKGLHAGYGKMEILHGVDLAVGAGAGLCLVGPNGAGKSTLLHAIFGFCDIFSGHIEIEGREVTALRPDEKLRDAGIAYILQDNSVFPDMTVEENLLMGGYLLPDRRAARLAVERIFDKYDRLAARRKQRAGALSGGERRLLEISRALIMEPRILLVDEPSIGLEPRFIDMVFDILQDLRDKEKKTILMVEQNAKRGLEFADIGYVLVSGHLAMAAPGDDLLNDPAVGRLFLGG